MVEAQANLIVKDRIMKRLRDTIIPTMDTTILVLRQRLVARDSLILSKDQTIKSLSGINGKALNTPLPWVLTVVGMLVMAFAIR